jgi:HK97 family phage prohead protease
MKITHAGPAAHKGFAFDLKEVDGQPGTFEGYGNVFGVVDSYREVVERGAFKRTLAHAKAAGKKIPLLWQHDTRQPIGTLSAVEDDHGLLVTASLVLGTEKGREAYELLKAGAINAMSIGYDVVKDKYDKTSGVRYLKEVRLWEVSLVTFPANEASLVTTVKAADFNATLQQEELQRMRWRMMDAISETIHEAMDDEMATPDARLALIDQSLTQFHAAMLAWASQAIAAGIKSADLIQDTKTATPTDATGTAPAAADPAPDAEGGPGQKSDDPPGEDPDVQALISEIKASADAARADQLIAELKAM